MLYVNADDLGWTREITDRILKCYDQQRIYTASAMAFMRDSERAAELSLEKGLPVGLHLNFIQGLTGDRISMTLRTNHGMVAAYLKAQKVNQILFNPFLRKAFDYVFWAQWDEFCRLYGKEPARLDGHHHMHLCMNMLFRSTIPRGIRIRRNFTFRSGEKGLINRLYRHLVDRWLRSRFQCCDYFFSIVPIQKQRLTRLVAISKSADVEIMVHPGVQEQYTYLLGPEWAWLISAPRAVDRVE